MKRADRIRKSLTPSAVAVVIDGEKPDVRSDADGWFTAYWNNEKIGRFCSEDGATKRWRRWRDTHAAGIVGTNAVSFGRIAQAPKPRSV